MLAYLLLATILVSTGHSASSGKESFDDKHMLEVFEGYFLKFWVHDYKNNDDDVFCALGVHQVYYSPPSDTVRFDSLRHIEITNYCATFDCPVVSFCPSANQTDVSRSHYWSGSELSGPYYRFGSAKISSKCKQVRVSFSASLINRTSGEELEYKTVNLEFKKRGKNWPIIEHQIGL
jgi:hypothetical protein